MEFDQVKSLNIARKARLFAGKSVRRGRLLLACIAAFCFLSVPAHADLMGLKVIVGDAVVVQGSGGSSFDVYLENLGPDPVTIRGFGFELSVSNPGITLEGTFISTENLPLNSPSPPAPYIFAGHSLFAINGRIDFGPPGSSQLAADVYDPQNAGVTVAVGPQGVVALGRVAFDVANSVVVGSYPVSLVETGTAFEQLSGNLITQFTVKDGQIGVNPVPEVSSDVLLLSVVSVWMLATWGKRHLAKTPLKTT